MSFATQSKTVLAELRREENATRGCSETKLGHLLAAGCLGHDGRSAARAVLKQLEAAGFARCNGDVWYAT